jgi:WD40 repeat protein
MDWKPDSAGAVYYVCPLQESARVLLGGQCRGLRVACLNAETGAFEWDREVLGRERRYTVGVEDIKLVPGAELFAVTGSEGDVMLHRLADGMPASGLMACPVRGRAIRFAGVDRLVLAGLRTTIWNWRTAERLTMPVPADFIPVGEALFLAPGKERLEVWRLEGQMPRLHDFKLGRGRTGFDLSADGRRALLAGDDGQAQWVDMETLTTLRILRNCAPEDTRALRMVRRPRVSADGTRAVVWVDAQTLALHDVGSTAEAGARVVRLQQPVMCAALSPDGRRLALGLEDGTWELRDAASGELQRACSELSHPPPGHGTNSPARGLCMEFSPDGRRLAIGTDRWTTASLWDSETGMPVQEPFMCGHGVRTVRIGHDGVLWSADWQGECLRFVEPPYHSHTRPGAPARRPPTAMFHAPVADLALSADGKWMAAGSWNTAARIFDQATLTQQGPDLQHTGEVTSVDWSPDGKRLLTATAAGEVCIWDRPTGRRLFSWPRLGAVVQAAFALNGTRIVLAGMDGVVHVREVHGGGSVRGDLPALLDELAAVPK